MTPDDMNGFEVIEVDDDGNPVAPPADDVAQLDRLIDTLSAKEGRSEFVGNLLKLGDMRKDMARDLTTISTFRDATAATRAAIEKLGERDGQIERLAQSQTSIVEAFGHMATRYETLSAAMREEAEARRARDDAILGALSSITSALADHGRVNGDIATVLKALPKALTPAKARTYKPAKFKVSRDLSNLMTEIEEIVE